MNTQRLTHSQRQLLEAARSPITRGCEVEIVRVEAAISGVSHAARQAERESRVSKIGPRCACLTTTSIYEAVCELVDEAGRDCWDAGNRRTLRRCLEKLSGPEHRPITLLFDRAGRLTENEQDTLKALCDAAAYRAGCRIRLVYLLNKVSMHEQQRNARGKLEWVQVRRWICSGGLLGDRERQSYVKGLARMWDYSADGMEEILGIPADDREQPRQREAASA